MRNKLVRRTSERSARELINKMTHNELLREVALLKKKSYGIPEEEEGESLLEEDVWAFWDRIRNWRADRNSKWYCSLLDELVPKRTRVKFENSGEKVDKRIK
ncbi:hypothetical protein L596_014292 [Steinernema carpocapsae]|uniref:Uncharacterized protein n=1 Tax=Steinernema carpocapsae TaxID=34508 RepID=A0A4U5NBI9_STECR|nr:hypothetical protein L596_014292 [Steinernema carpocapsae]